ncbi:MAG: phosphatidylinositol-specific phospholipase C/glycerophosphodiester phosphodiesterase family protein [Runella sp.]
MRFLICFILLYGQITSSFGQITPPISLREVVPLPNAHAHNDYEHPRPLWDALARGFTSIEADVYLINDTLFVSHYRPKALLLTRTLEEMYLKPLQHLSQSQQGRIYPHYDGVFYLMIDFKTEAESTYKALEKLLLQYQELLSFYQNHRYFRRAVTVFISGNRPVETLRRSAYRQAALDGRPSDLGQGFDNDLMPIVSDTYWKYSTWKGDGPLPDESFERLQQLAQAVHQEGKKLRLWATPENPVVWQKLREAGVDFINTDQLEMAKAFLLKN